MIDLRGNAAPAFLLEEEKVRRMDYEKSSKPVFALIDADCESTGELIAPGQNTLDWVETKLLDSIKN